ncbi:peptidase S16, partial [Blyttiomyces helicus]
MASKQQKPSSIPRSIPLIPTRNNRVLYPGVVLRLQIRRNDTLQLMDQLWEQHAKGQVVIVGCVPVKPSAAAAQSNSNRPTVPLGPRPPLLKKPVDDVVVPIDPSQLFEWGTAARVISFIKNNPYQSKMSRGAAYIVTLEGISRFKIDKITKTNPYFEAAITVFPEPEINKQDPEMHGRIIALRQAGH